MYIFKAQLLNELHNRYLQWFFEPDDVGVRAKEREGTEKEKPLLIATEGMGFDVRLEGEKSGL